MDLVFQLALQYGQGQLTEAGIAWAMEKLGIAAPKQSEIDIFTGGGINRAFSPGSLTNMFKRAGVRLGANTLMKGAGSSLLPFAGITGLAMLGNKYRKQLTGYDTQSAYEAAKEKRIADKRLDRITNRMLDDKAYGNYEEALLGSGAGAVKIDDVIMSGADNFPEKSYKDTEPESTEPESIENITRTDIPDRGRGQDNVSRSPSKAPSKAPSRPSRHTSGRGGLHSGYYNRGGIASL